MAEEKENKVVRGYSLSRVNINWLAERALALRTATTRMSDSQYLDNLISAKREEGERAKRILKSITPPPAPSPNGDGKSRSKAVTG